ncbi:hypothetical protein EJV47_24190 [Hymenobacter gummosus]|uniref:2-dehydro-3-deoxyphosphooctonate aldolase n=1 Tax=Hymenobacter gummosus TaxID=1776032 RepID=A0A431TVA0_9BACT|nr:hypothetical protein [Hymenobacter gummosus]RTQ45597.1 hypothetical protein EJV47_24190 [Hymenobacter gummosus]
MKRYLYAAIAAMAVLASACAGAKATTATADNGPRLTGSNNVPQSYYDQARRTVAPFALVEASPDADYGYTAEKPACVGGIKDNDCARNEQRFLNALRGPEGQEISCRRLGSCCGFSTPNGLINNMGLLDVYQLTWPGQDKPVKLYLNCYDSESLRIPQGLRVAGL